MNQAPGYSGKQLADKLGIKSGDLVWVLSAPKDYLEWVGECEASFEFNEVQPSGAPNLIHAFCGGFPELCGHIETAEPYLDRGVILWVSWIKGKAVLSD